MNDNHSIEVETPDGLVRMLLEGEHLSLLRTDGQIIHQADGVLAGLHMPNWGFCYVRLRNDGERSLVVNYPSYGEEWAELRYASESQDWIAVEMETPPVPVAGNERLLVMLRKETVTNNPPILCDSSMYPIARSHHDQRLAVATTAGVAIWNPTSMVFGDCEFGNPPGYTEWSSEKLEWSADDRWIARTAKGNFSVEPTDDQMTDIALFDSTTRKQVVRLLLWDCKHLDWEGDQLKIWCAVCNVSPAWHTTRVITIAPETGDVTVDNLLQFVPPEP